MKHIRQRVAQLRIVSKISVLQTHWHRQVLRRLTFNPLKDITIKRRMCIRVTIHRHDHLFGKLNGATRQILTGRSTISRSLSVILRFLVRVSEIVGQTGLTISARTTGTLNTGILGRLNMLTFSPTRRQYRRGHTTTLPHHRSLVNSLINHLTLGSTTTFKAIQNTRANRRRARVIVGLNCNTGHQTEIFEYHLLISQRHQQGTIS